MDHDSDVRWVPSQSPIPALQALIREAERDKKAKQPSLSDPYAAPISTRTTPLPAAHRKLLAPSARSPQASVPLEGEPEAVAFVGLLKDAFKQLDENALKKQRLAKEKQRERSCRDPRPLAKTSSAFAICPAGPASSVQPESRGHALTKTASLRLRGDIASGKSTHSLPSHSLNPNPASAPQLPVRAPTAPNSAAPKPRTPADGDSPMEDVIDLTETDTDWERPITSPYNQEVDDDSDSGMDVSFFQSEPLPPTYTSPPAPKPKPQPPQPSTVPRPPPIQRPRIGPPPLGMRRAAYLPPSQYSSSQSAKGATVPRFKPPFLTNTASSANRSATGSKSATTMGSLPTSRPARKTEVVPKSAQDPDSSFDVSFDMDIDALEETMKAYD